MMIGLGKVSNKKKIKQKFHVHPAGKMELITLIATIALFLLTLSTLGCQRQIKNVIKRKRDLRKIIM